MKIKKNNILTIGLLSMLCLTIMAFTNNTTTTSNGEVKDIDGNTYKTVKIGEQEWMAENLNVSHFRNGDEILHATSVKEWKKAAKKGTPAWCYYRNDVTNEKSCGKLYNWYAVNDSRGLAPKGYKVPSVMEWDKMIDHISSNKQYKDVYLRDSLGWPTNDAFYGNLNGTNESGFSARPGNSRGEDGKFNPIQKGMEGKEHLTNANWWLADEDTILNHGRYFNIGAVFDCRIISNSGKGDGYSVRCIKE